MVLGTTAGVTPPADDQDQVGAESSGRRTPVKKYRISEETIIAILKQAEAGVTMTNW
jgi:hypothetical protein